MIKLQFSDINDGISKKHRQDVGDSLARVLANTYSLYLQTHNFHWNVTGTMFNALHSMFEIQYNELFLAVDLLAERIRALGFFAPGTPSEFVKLSSIKEQLGNIDAIKMVKVLIVSHEETIKVARETLKIAEKANDQVSIDLVSERLQVHEKTVWMLRSIVY